MERPKTFNEVTRIKKCTIISMFNRQLKSMFKTKTKFSLFHVKISNTASVALHSMHGSFMSVDERFECVEMA